MKRRSVYVMLAVCITTAVSVSLVLLRPQPFHALDNRGAVVRSQLRKAKAQQPQQQPLAGDGHPLLTGPDVFARHPLKRSSKHHGKPLHDHRQPPATNALPFKREGHGLQADGTMTGAPRTLPDGSSRNATADLTNVTTYDDILRLTVDPKHYVFPVASPARDVSTLSPFHEHCDDITVPFEDPIPTERCIAFMASVTRYVASLDGSSKSNANNGNVFRVPCAVVFGAGSPSCAASDKANDKGGGAAGGGGDGAGPGDALLTIEPMKQQFEQRTIKFKATLRLRAGGSTGGSSTGPATAAAAAGGSEDRAVPTAWIIKVPQVLFPIEPFAEVAAHHLDRKLGIHRIPPTSLVALPIAWIRAVSLARSERKMPMVNEFLVASSVKSYDEWIDKDFVAFLRHDVDGRYVADPQPHGANATLAWCSVQLFMREVQPILYSTLRVPYSKTNPGWHRWFDVNFAEYPVAVGPLLALSELSVFDFIIRNNDRSPNKNNFIVGACKKCWPRRPSGHVPTLVHLDHGMSFYGPNSHTVHNPLSKPKDKLKFCIFYRPMITRFQAMSRELLAAQARNRSTASGTDGGSGGGGGGSLADDTRAFQRAVESQEQQRAEVQDPKSPDGVTLTRLWEAYLSASMPAAVVRAVGPSRLACGSQVVKVLARVETCIGLFNASAVLRP